MIATTETLNEILEFNRVVKIDSDGAVTILCNINVPEISDSEIEGVSGGWELLRGYSSQYGVGNTNANMHASEIVAGDLARNILAEPGIYVTLLDYVSDDCPCSQDEWHLYEHGCTCDPISGWVIARHTTD